MNLINKKTKLKLIELEKWMNFQISDTIACIDIEPTLTNNALAESCPIIRNFGKNINIINVTPMTLKCSDTEIKAILLHELGHTYTQLTIINTIKSELAAHLWAYNTAKKKKLKGELCYIIELAAEWADIPFSDKSMRAYRGAGRKFLKIIDKK